MSERDELTRNIIVRKLLKEMHFDHVSVQTDHFVISEQVREDLIQGLVIQIGRILHSSLFRMFLEYLNERDVLDAYIQNDNSEELDPYRQSFADTITLSSFQEKLPTLIGMAERICVQYQSVVSEMLERMDACYEEICRELLAGRQFRELVRISTDSGDVHNHGHTTSVIETDAGKIVYKPHDVGIDQKSYELISTFFSDIMAAPKVCQRDGYGFVEFIVNEPADTDEKARKYFYNLGGLATVVLMLGSSDLHHSNVLARGIYPVIIDYELMVTPGYGLEGKSLQHDIRYSLLQSSLMPQRKDDHEMSILFARDEKNVSSPLIDGQRKCMTDYPDEFFRGFEDTYRKCMERCEELKEFVRSMKDICVRHIYRNTTTYSILLNKITEPAWIEDPGVRDELVRQLNVAMKRSGATNAGDIAEAEADAMMRGDIPYMYIRTNTTDLYSEGRTVYRNFFRQSCIDYVLSRIDYLNEIDLAYETALLRKAMTRVVRRHQRGPEIRERILARRDISDEELLKHAEQIFREIAEDAVETPSGEIVWFGLNYFQETGMKIFDTGLIEGTGGLAIFFAALYRITKDPAIREKTAELTERIMDRLDRILSALEQIDVIYPNVENVSFSTGMSGKLLSCYLCGKYMNNEKYMQMGRRIIALLGKMDMRYEKTDVYNGIAGLLKMLCRYDAFFNEPGAKELCESLAERLVKSAGIPYKDKKIWKTLSPAWAISGAGHGQSGVASALYMAGKRLQREDLIAAAQPGFDFEREIYSVSIGAWPDRRGTEKTDEYMTGYCSGAPGIGMNAVLLKYDGYEEVLKRAIRSTLKEPLMHKDFLCCGNSAMAEFLLIAGRQLQRDDLIQEARTRMAMVISRAERNGHYSCISRSMDYVFSATLFYGTAGIGYEMLRLIDPQGLDSLLL